MIFDFGRQRMQPLAGILICLVFLAGLPVQPVQAKSSQTAITAVKTALLGQFSEAFNLAQKSRDLVALELIEWLYVTGHATTAGHARLERFAANRPHWPRARRLLKISEASMLKDNVSTSEIAAVFARRKPISPEGKLALARVKLAKKQKSHALKLIKAAWYDNDLTRAGEAYAWKKFAKLMTGDVKAMRLWVLLHDQQTNRAVRFAKKLSRHHAAAARAAQLLIRVKPAGRKAYRKLPKSMQRKKALQYALARYHRKAGDIATARAMLVKLPAGYGRDVDPAAWWIEKRLVIRNSIGPNHQAQWKSAYRLAASHGFSKGKHFSEGEFLAGWLALRRLGQPKRAVTHFTRMARKARTRTAASRALYWLGRSYLALGNNSAAEQVMKQAAATPTLYYAQLAREHLGLGKRAIRFPVIKVGRAARRQAQSDEMMRAVALLVKAGGTSRLESFLKPLAGRFQHHAHHAAVAEQLSKLAGITYAVRYAKHAGGRGFDIDRWAYPSGMLPKWRTVGKPVEKAVIYGLARQESEFYTRAKSGAGARGLMQLMPGTAKSVARRYKIKHSTGKLSSSPAHNLTLGSTFLRELLDRNGGSYIMSFAGYNAGPGNVAKWVELNGDPRSPNINAIDWVEQIPFTETRNYVKKVLQNVQVYRSLLSPRRVRAITADLALGSHTVKKVSGCDSSAGTIAALLQNC